MPHNSGDAAKAFRLRKKIRTGETLQPVDQLWLSNYDDRVMPTNGSKNHGRSRSARKMEFKLEEAAEAEGTGTAAAVAASNALMVREEGRRIDALAIGAVDTLKEAVAVYKDMCLSMRERYEVLEHTHIEMLQTVRAHYLRTVEVEGEMLKNEAVNAGSGDPATGMVLQMLAQHFGLNVPGGAAVKLPRPPANGAKS